MSRNEQTILPYEANEHHQLLIDTIKLRNRTLLHFLLDLKKEAPRLTADEIGMGLLSNFQKRFIAMFDANLTAAFSTFVRQAAFQPITDTTTSWEQQVQAFSESLEAIKTEKLAHRADSMRSEIPRVDNTDQPDMEARISFFMNEAPCEANYREMMQYYDRKFTEVLDRNCTEFQAILSKGKKSAISMRVRDHINRQQMAKDQLVAHLEKEMGVLVAEQTAGQLRESAITVELAGKFGEDIPERLLAMSKDPRVALIFKGISLHNMLPDIREMVMSEINRQNADGDSFTHFVVQAGDLKLIAWLLDQGVDLTLLNARRVRPLDQAITATGMTLLERALHDEDLASFKKYLSAGIDPMLENARQEKQTILDVLYAIGSDGNGNLALRKNKEVVYDFLSLFLDYLAEKKVINVWSTEIVAVQRFILQTREEPLDHRAFEKKLEELKWKIIHYLQDVLLERVEDNWLIEKPLFTWESSYKHFKMRWDHCNELLLAMRQSVKECNPKILDAVIQKQKQDLDANPGMTGPFKQSRLHRSTSEVVLRQQTDMELFIQKRDEHRLVRAAEAQKQREWDEMKLQVRSLTDQLAASEAARRADQEEARRNQEEARRNQEEARRNQEEARRSQEEARRSQEEARRNQEVMSTQMGTLTTQVASLTQKLAKSERTTQILLARLLAKEGIDATVPEEDEAETARHEPTTSSSSPAANPHSLFVGSQQPVTTAPRAASNDQPIIHQIEEVDTHYSHS